MEERLRIDVVPTLVGEVGTAVHLATVARLYSEVIRDVDAVVEQLHFDILVEDSEIDALLQGLVGGGIEDVIDHLVEQGLLIDIAVADNLLQRLRGLDETALVGAQDHGLGHGGGLDGEGLQLEAGIDRPVVGRDGKLMRLLHGAIQAVDRHSVL